MEGRRPARFQGRHFPEEIIVLCVRWYLRYCLTYRDLEELMAERGLSVDHSTIAGCCGMAQTCTSAFEEIRACPIVPGVWTRLTFASPASGLICTGLSILPETPSISCSRRSGMRLRPSIFCNLRCGTHDPSSHA